MLIFFLIFYSFSKYLIFSYLFVIWGNGVFANRANVFYINFTPMQVKNQLYYDAS